MGDYLKEAYLLAELNKNIDDDYQKLYDKLHELKLSYNRKKRVLNKIRGWANVNIMVCDKLDSREVSISKWSFEVLLKLCNDALFSDGRVNFPIVKRKKKGGRQCAQD